MIKKYYISLIALYAFTLLFSLPVHASDYLVSNIKVNVTSESATQAREDGLKNARRNAFNILIRKMLSNDEKASLPHTKDSVIATMVDSFEINKEKLSKNQYLASVNVLFNERAVQSYLGRHTSIALNYYGDYSSAANNAPYDQTVNNHNASYLPIENRTIPSSITKNKIVAHFDIRNIRQWINAKRSLQSIPSIADVSVQSLKSQSAVIALSYHGSLDQLKNDLRMKGMRIEINPFKNQSGNPDYLLSTNG